ncbi:hypothetical protein ACP70R_005664 [Stipagrostis hirtigluma subsp. patula]
MGTDQGDVAVGGGGVDRISDLPDDLLHAILLRLPGGTADAARTSVLSRRWRRVWARLPELSFRYGGGALPVAGSFARAHDRVDSALAAYAAPTATRLEISLPRGPWSADAPVGRVAPWLRFASQRLAGELLLSRPYSRDKCEEHELAVPLCDRVTEIRFNNLGCTLRFPLPAARAFSALATLNIKHASFDGDELEALVSSRCPRLKKLFLRHVALLDEAAVLSIRSATLEHLRIKDGSFARIHVAAPELQMLLTYFRFDARITAPRLSKLCCYNKYGYDPSRHYLAEAGPHLQQLVITLNNAAALMQRFNTVDELVLGVDILEGVHEYKRFLKKTHTISKRDVLVVRLWIVHHALKPTMLRLLRKCAGTRKIVVDISSFSIMGHYSGISTGCPCRRPKSSKTDHMSMDSLEEVEVNHSAGRSIEDTQELVKLLCGCSLKFRKNVTITVLVEGSQSEHVRRNISSIHAPSNKIEIIVRSK